MKDRRVLRRKQKVRSRRTKEKERKENGERRVYMVGFFNYLHLLVSLLLAVNRTLRRSSWPY